MRRHLLGAVIGWIAVIFSALGQHSPLDQRVSVTATNTSVQQVLTDLTATYQLRFSYAPDLLPLQRKVSLQANQQPLRQVLDQLFRGAGIRYQVIGSQVVLQFAPQASANEKKELTISGHVTDKTSGEALIGASVLLAGQLTSGVNANTYGFYSLRRPTGPVQLQVRYLGYAPLDVPLGTAQRDTVIALQLQPLARELAEVQVIGEQITDLEQANRLSLRGVELKQLPRLMGEADAVKALQLLPGVQAGREGSSDLSVRGGGLDQNLVLLDGVPVYNVSHLLGTFSVFNPDAVKSVDLIKGSFPAQYGGRLSSVVDVRLKEGNNQQFGGEGALGLISSKLLLEGPIKNEKTSFLVAARRTYLDLLTTAAALASGQKNRLNYNFYDLNAKVNHTISSTDKLYLSLYGGQDGFVSKNNEQIQKFAMRWGNATGALRWNHTFGPRLFSNATLIYSRYRFSQQTSNEQQQGDRTTSRLSDYYSNITDWGAKVEFDFFANERHNLRFGGNYTFHTFDPEAFKLKTDSLTFTSNSFARIRAHEVYAYVEDRIQLTERIQASVGLHASGFGVNGTFYTSLQPRLALGYASASGFGVRASYVTMAQYLHLLSNVSIGTPTDIWVPSTDKVKPQRSWQTTLGVSQRLGPQWELTSDVYYKQMRGVTEFRDGGDFLTEFLSKGPATNFASLLAAPYETRLVSGKGWSYGSEWLLRKHQGKTTGWLGYTLAWAWRQMPGINFDRKYPYTYDSRHSFSLVANHQFTSKLSVGATWVYRTGFATTLPLEDYKAYNEPVYRPGGSSDAVETVYAFGERNNYRMNAYHRLDVSLTHTKKKKWGERSWNVSVYNAYNHKNPYYLYLSKSGRYSGISQFSLFPILPSFSYGFRF
jgi:hypothetical protein